MPKVDITRAGSARGQALSSPDLGQFDTGGLKDLAGLIQKQNERRKRLEDTAFVSKNSALFRTQATDDFFSLQKEATEGAPGFTENYFKQFDERKKQLLKEAPSPEAGALLEQRIESYRSSLYPQVVAFESSEFSKKVVNDYSIARNERANEVYRAPDTLQELLIEAAQDRLNLSDDLSETQIQVLKSEDERLLTEMSLRGFVDTDPLTAIKLIETGQYDKILAPDLLRNLHSQAIQNSKSQDRIAQARFQFQVNDSLAVLSKTGDPNIMLSLEDFQEVYNEEDAIIKYETYQRSASAVIVGYDTDQALRENPELLFNNDAWDQYKKDNFSGDTNQQHLVQIEASYDGIREQRKNAFLKDPATYLISTNDKLKNDWDVYTQAEGEGRIEAFTNYVGHLLSLYEDFVPLNNVKLLPESYAKVLGDTLSSASPAELEGIITELEQQFDVTIEMGGEELPLGQIVYNQIQTEANLPIESLIALQTVGTAGYRYAINAMQLKEEDFIKFDTNVTKVAEDVIQEHMLSLAPLINGGSSVGRNFNTLKGYENLVLRATVAHLINHPSASPKDTADLMFQRIVGSVYQLDYSEDYLIPYFSGSMPLNGDVITHNTKQYAKRLPIAGGLIEGLTIWHPTKGYVPISTPGLEGITRESSSGIITVGGVTKEEQEVFFRDFMEQAYWIQSPDNTGLELYIPSSDGLNPIQIVLPDGSPFKVTWPTLNKEWVFPGTDPDKSLAHPEFRRLQQRRRK